VQAPDASPGSVSVATGTGWAVHLGTADQTWVRLILETGPNDPWPLPRALTELGGIGVRRQGPPRTLGRGHGMPLLSSQELRWSGCELYIEVAGDGRGGVEAGLSLPSWDELVDAVAAEDAVWELVDAAAAALDAGWGAIGDGAALASLRRPATPAEWLAVLDRHLGVLVPEGEGVGGAVACRYRTLPLAGLDVLLR